MSDTRCPISGCEFESTSRGVVSHASQVHETERVIEKDIQRISERNGGAPTFEEYKDEGLHTSEALNRTFGSFGTALSSILGVDSDECVSTGCSLQFTDVRRMNSHITRDHNVKQLMLDDLNELADEIGKIPTSNEYLENGHFTDITIQRHFGSYNVALIEAGLAPKNAKGLSDNHIREIVGDLVEDLGYVPSQPVLNEHLSISAATVCRRFGETDRYHESMRELGYDYTEAPAGQMHWESIYHKMDVLIGDLNRLGEKFGRVTGDVVDDHGRFDSMTYIRTFGGLTRALEQSDLETYGVRSGEDHPHWNGGVRDWRGSNWKHVRQLVRDRDDHQCRVCGVENGYGRRGLEVHHITPFREFDDYENANDLDNLVLVCTSCHRQNENKWTSESIENWIELARAE